MCGGGARHWQPIVEAVQGPRTAGTSTHSPHFHLSYRAPVDGMQLMSVVTPMAHDRYFQAHVKSIYPGASFLMDIDPPCRPSFLRP